MKLVNKISLWFISIVLLVTPVCMYISYSSIKKRLDTAETKRMKGVNEMVALQLKNGQTPELYTQGRPITVAVLATPLPATATEVKEECTYISELKRKECRLTVNSYYHIGDKNYKISSYNFVTKSDEILAGMMNALVWKVVLIIVAVAVTGRLLSKKIFSPFRQAMDAIHHFNLKQKEKIKLPVTNTREFRELNSFLQKMTDKAMEDYASVKEFSENAAHELQTPLAVIRSKLELFSETNIDSTQAALISDMQNAIDKLSRINRSLALLTKLENQEFETSEEIKFCRITKDVLAAYDDWISLKNIKVQTRLDRNIQLQIHPTLAEMLVTNLLSNAIRHNVEAGVLTIELTSSHFSISNTGAPPEMPTHELFQRFKKGNQCAESVGLGLAIVKQICEVSRFTIDYQYQDGLHKINVYFDKKDIEPKVMPQITHPELEVA